MLRVKDLRIEPVRELLRGLLVALWGRGPFNDALRGKLALPTPMLPSRARSSSFTLTERSPSLSFPKSAFFLELSAPNGGGRGLSQSVVLELARHLGVGGFGPTAPLLAVVRSPLRLISKLGPDARYTCGCGRRPELETGRGPAALLSVRSEATEAPSKAISWACSWACTLERLGLHGGVQPSWTCNAPCGPATI